MGCSHFCKNSLFAVLLIQDSRQKVASTLSWWCTVFWWKQMAVSWKVALSELRMRTYLLTWRLAYCWKLERSAKKHQNCHVVVLYAIHSCWYGIRVLLARLGVEWGGGGWWVHHLPPGLSRKYWGQFWPFTMQWAVGIPQHAGNNSWCLSKILDAKISLSATILARVLLLMVFCTLGQWAHSTKSRNINIWRFSQMFCALVALEKQKEQIWFRVL